MEVGVWDGNFWPSYFAEAIKTIKFLYEALHIFNRSGVAGAVLQSPLLLIHLMINGPGVAGAVL